MPSLDNFSDKAKQDYELVKKARKGDQQAYTKLLSRYRDSIYFMVLKMVNDKDEAEDLTIEAFGKAFSRIDQYTPQYAFSTWLFRIASNNCIDYLRKKRLNVLSIDKDYDTDDFNPLVLKSKSLDPEEATIKTQKEQLLRDVVGTMKPRYRALIELRYFEEYSYEEISQHLDIPLGTVKAQLYRAKEFLLNLLQKTNGNF